MRRVLLVLAGLLGGAAGWTAEADQAKRGDLMVVKNLTKGNVVASRVVVAKTHGTRRKGLLGHKSLDAAEGMLLVPCRSVHTRGMKFAIDVVLLDRERRVVKVVADVKPGRFMIRATGTYCILELASGVAAAKRVEAGDHLEVIEPEMEEKEKAAD